MCFACVDTFCVRFSAIVCLYYEAYTQLHTQTYMLEDIRNTPTYFLACIHTHTLSGGHHSWSPLLLPLQCVSSQSLFVCLIYDMKCNGVCVCVCVVIAVRGMWCHGVGCSSCSWLHVGTTSTKTMCCWVLTSDDDAGWSHSLACCVYGRKCWGCGAAAQE